MIRRRVSPKGLTLFFTTCLFSIDATPNLLPRLGYGSGPELLEVFSVGLFHSLFQAGLSRRFHLPPFPNPCTNQRPRTIPASGAKRLRTSPEREELRAKALG